MAKALRVTCAKPRDPPTLRRCAGLAEAEQSNTKAAIKFFRVRLGGYAKLAVTLGAPRETAVNAPRGRVGVALKLRGTRVAGVTADDVLSGRRPVNGACPHCERWQ